MGYRLEVSTWDDVPEGEGTLERVVARISDAAQLWHRCGGNWYKVFRIFDEDESGAICFDEFREIVRRPCPCLAISKKSVSDRDLKALWKVMDDDLSSYISVSEFMVFMRRVGAKHADHRSHAIWRKLTPEQESKDPHACLAKSGTKNVLDMSFSDGGVLMAKQA